MFLLGEVLIKRLGDFADLLDHRSREPDPIMGSRPVRGRPRFLRLFAMIFG